MFPLAVLNHLDSRLNGCVRFCSPIDLSFPTITPARINTAPTALPALDRLNGICWHFVVCELITGELSVFKGNFTSSNLPFETISQLQLGSPCWSLGNHVSITHRGDGHNHKPWFTAISQMPTSLVSLEPKPKTPGELGQNPWMMLSKGVSLKHRQRGKEKLLHGLQACNCSSE